MLGRLAGVGGPTAVVRAAPADRSVADLLESGTFDMVVVRGVVDLPGISAFVVAREAVGVAVPTDHPLAVQPSIAPADLSDVPLVWSARNADPGEFDRIHAPLAAAGMRQLRLVYESHPGAVESSLRLVEQGVGLSLKLASEVSAFHGPRVTWRPLDGVALDVIVSAAWRLDRITPSLRPLIRVVEEQAASASPETRADGQLGGVAHE